MKAPAARAVAGLALISGMMWFVPGRPALVASPVERPGHAGHAAMTDAAMQRWSNAWWATHSPVGIQSTQAPSATFTVGNFLFDNDNNALTQVDTAKIMMGQSVLWQWVVGFHTVTNGSGSGDPNVGTLFDQPSDSGHQQFTFTFNTAGTFLFFCRQHELNNMRGVVRVSAPAGVEPSGAGPLGFTAEPAPNPARAGARFGFALRQPGRVRAEVFDARGRRVAVVLDRDFETGPHEGTWDGRTAGGAAASAGLYYLRLSLPGYSGSHAIVVAR